MDPPAPGLPADPGLSARRDELLEQWATGLRIGHIAHSRTASRYAANGRAIGMAVAILSAVVGTSIFATLEHVPGTAIRVAAGLLSVVATVLAALQTFLDYTARASRHRQTAARYGTLRRRLEEARASDRSWDDVRAIVDEWNALDEEAPDVPDAFHAAAVQRAARRSREREEVGVTRC